MNDSKFCCLFSSYNNYELWPKLWFRKNKSDLSNKVIFNADCGSSEENLKLRDLIIEKCPYEIIDLDLKEDEHQTSSMRHFEKTIEYLEKNDIECDWLVWFTHDGYPTQENFWSLLEERLESLKEYKDTIGAFGFKTLNTPQNLSPRADSYARANLVQNIDKMPHPGWYTNLPEEYLESDHFVVESPVWVAFGINIALFKEYIQKDYQFKIEYFGDDIAYQFATKDIATVIFPDIIINHDCWEKNSLGIPNSGSGSKKYHANLRDFGDYGSLWKNKYKWSWGARTTRARDEFIENIEIYKGTLMEGFYNRSIFDGPLTLQEYYGTK